MIAPTLPENPLELFEMYATVAQRGPGRSLIRMPGNGPTLTSARLLDEAVGLSRGLAEAGLRTGDTLLLGRASGAGFVIAMLAAWRCGAAPIAADARTSIAELAVLRDGFAPRLTLLQESGHGTGPGRFSIRAGEPRAACRAPAGTAVIKLTSGTAGAPRGVATTAAQLVADAITILIGMRIHEQDVGIGVIPLSHSYGLSSLLMPLVIQGSPILITPSSVPGMFIEALAIEEPAFFPGVPYLYELATRDVAARFRRRGLHTCISAGALLPAATAEAFNARFGLPVRAFYGTSETGGITFDASPGGDAAMKVEGCVGTPLPGVSVRLEPETSRVIVRSAAVASGYLGKTFGKTEASGGFRDGGFVTADVGRFEPRDGRCELRLTGRIGAVVNVAGRKVDPREVEQAILGLADVRESAVLGVPDPVRGESLAAFIVAGPEVTREKILANLRGMLAPWKVPRQVFLVERMPRTERGKLNTEALRRRAASSMDT